MIYTIGHSTLVKKDFVKTLGHIRLLWDIRSHPGSKWPWFNQEEMRKWLPACNKKYAWKPSLGGMLGVFNITPYVPAILVICSKCGMLTQHSVYILGLLEPEPTKLEIIKGKNDNTT